MMASEIRRLRNLFARIGRCETCGHWSWNLEDDEVVTDYPFAHNTAFVRQCRSCWDDAPRRLTIRWFFEPRDIWIGVFWDRAIDDSLKVYVCLIPMLPLLLHFAPGEDR
jgi:hypothetical protein